LASGETSEHRTSGPVRAPHRRSEPVRPALVSTDETFDAFFRRHYGRVREFASHHTSADDAEDFTRQAFVSVFHELERTKVTDDETARGQVYRDLYSRLKDAHKAEHKRPPGVHPWMDSARAYARRVVRNDEESEVLVFAAAIERAMQRLSPLCREAVALVREQELTYLQASEALGVPASTVRALVVRGQVAIHRALRMVGYRPGRASVIPEVKL
jgi:RNA polymerase sigma factor (sigma-70 family)